MRSSSRIYDSIFDLYFNSTMKNTLRFKYGTDFALRGHASFPRRFQRRLISRQKLAELISPLYRALPVFNFREMQTIFFFLPFFPSATLNCANIRQWRMLFRRGCRFVEFPHFPRLIKSLNRGDIVIFILPERNEDE